MSYDATAKTLRCPYCGSERLEKKDDIRAIQAQRVIPFRFDQAAAQATLRQWLGRGFWRPSDLASAATIANISGVYVPYWVFSADVHTYWTADSSVTPPGARADWYPVTGENRSSYSGLLVGASSVLSPQETEAICPFDLGAAVDASSVDLDNAIVEQFTVPRKYARPLARRGLEHSEERTCAERYLPRSHRNLKANIRIEQLRSEPILFPVWVMAYRYRDDLYRILINGQTGTISGDAPFSKFKAFMVGSFVILAALVIVILFALANR
ncbi:MAG: hypothetical protein KDB27_14210 [Planctomycetales bacterium]|nr:hypothetical protein [Planctomycetales bacterium]